MVFALMGWLLACQGLYKLGQQLGQLSEEQQLVTRLDQQLKTRNPYSKITTITPASQCQERLLAVVIKGLHQGKNLSPCLHSLGELLTIDIEQLQRQREMTKLILGKALIVMATCLGFRMYFMPWFPALLPQFRQLDMVLCLAAGLAIAAVARWWQGQLPPLRSLKLRQQGYRDWLATMDMSSMTERREGLAAEGLKERLQAELSLYRPKAQQRTRSLEDVLGILDLAGNGVIAALTLICPLSLLMVGMG